MQWQWSDEGFCQRVVARCRELGKSQREILRQAQCAHDYLQTNPTHGRRIDRVWRIAEALECGVADILGIPVNGQIEPDLLLIAYRAAQEAMQAVQTVDDANFVRTMSIVYNQLLDRRAQGHDPRDPQFLQTLIGFLRTMGATPQPT